MDTRLGRAQYFVIQDTESGEVEALDNAENLNAMQGAGVQAGQNLANAGVEAVLTGNCGPKAFQVLDAAGVKVYLGISGTVADALAAFKDGKLQLADAANKPGHWA